MRKEVKLSEIMFVVLLSGSLLTMVQTGVLTLAFNVQQVKAVPTSDGGVCTVCIRADGSVDPSTAPIQRDGDIYTLTGNIICDVNSDGIVIERNDMILDGATYMLQGISGSEQVGGAVSGRGITLSGRSNVTIRNIMVAKFAWGILLLVHCFNNSIVGNTITNNGNIALSLDHSWNNSITGNNITNNNLGIHVCSSSNNSIYHNNFIDNTRQVDVTTPSYANPWDNDYPSGGNYWSNYKGVDMRSGPDLNESGSDGIGDTSYFIDENNRDHYPFMNPIDPPAPIETSVNDPVPVGGVCIPIQVKKLEAPTPYIGVASTILVITVAMASMLNMKKRRTKPRA